MLTGKMALSAASTALLAGAWVAHEGLIRVSVDDTKPGKEPAHLHLIVPAALAPAVLHLAPEHALRSGLEQARPWMPAARVACKELGRLADTDLVEVRNAHEHVRVSTRSGHLVIDVESRGETVHVSFPLRTAWRLAKQIESSGPSS
jgi:hypothetical protein